MPSAASAAVRWPLQFRMRSLLLPLRDRFAFANLLPPHRVIQAFLLKQLRVPSKFNNASALQHVDSVGMHHRGKPDGQTKKVFTPSFFFVFFFSRVSLFFF